MRTARAATAGGPDSVDAGRLLAAVRGVDPVACELVTRAVGFRGGGSSGMPGAAAGEDAGVREVVEFAVGRGGEGVEAVLAAGLTDPDPCVRRVAALRLGRVGTEVATRRLLETLESADPAAREAAALGLGESGEEAAVPSLLRRLTTDDTDRVRRAAAWAIGRIEG